MKNEGNRIPRLEPEISTKTKIFEKKPNRGGTPASERITRASTLVKTFVDPKFENENNVLMFVPVDCNTVVNSRKEVIL